MDGGLRSRGARAGVVAAIAIGAAAVAGASAAAQSVARAGGARTLNLNATLDEMKVVEEMRRTLREIRDVNHLDSN